MDLFGLNRFFNAPEKSRPPKKGVGRYFEVFYDNLGAILGANILTCAGFLPLALAGGALGGAVAGCFWCAMNAIVLQCFRGGCAGWFGRWRGSMARLLAPAALQGTLMGLLGAIFLSVGSFSAAVLEDGGRPPLLVWIAVGLDLFLLALAAAVLFPALCVSEARFAERARRALSVLFRAPVRLLASAAVLLLWGGLLTGLFPASVPLSLVLGFWPPALLCAQLLLPPLSAAFDVEGALDAFEPAPAPVRGLTAGQRTEIWWRRRWPLVLGMVVCVSLFAGVLGTMLDRGEPDMQIAVVHADALPDGVLSALEDALSEQVGDINGDGAARVMVNDYPVVFDGSAKDTDIQTAGMARLVTDVAAGDSALFLVDDPDGFLSVYGDKMDADAARLWSDCPILAVLNAGTFSTVEDIYTDVDGQALLGGLTVFPARSAGDEAIALLVPFN